MNFETDEYYMSLALSLAEKGRGKVSPNPMVGAVVVRDGKVIGQGYHLKAGEDHAEVIALCEAGENAHGATLYVTLEPCCHHGKTPPCIDAISRSGIRRVVSAMMDENPLVCGKGIAILREKNIEMVVGILEDRARKLNESYLKFITTGTPFVTLKLASTLDGRIADSRGKSKWITGTETRKRIHLWRSWSDALMVGIGTVLADDPELTVRETDGSSPLRVIVDSCLKTLPDAKVLADSNVIIAATDTADTARLTFFEKHGIEVWTLEAKDGKVSLLHLLQKLGKRNITSVFCEGGSLLATSLLKERLVDKMIFTIAPKILGSGIPAVRDLNIGGLDNAITLKDREIDLTGEDIIVIGYPVYNF